MSATQVGMASHVSPEMMSSFTMGLGPGDLDPYPAAGDVVVLLVVKPGGFPRIYALGTWTADESGRVFWKHWEPRGEQSVTLWSSAAAPEWEVRAYIAAPYAADAPVPAPGEER